MNWIDINNQLPKEGIEVKIKFDCKKECEGFAYYIKGDWFSIIALLCSDHNIYNDEDKDRYANLKKQIKWWQDIEKMK